MRTRHPRSRHSRVALVTVLAGALSAGACATPATPGEAPSPAAPSGASNLAAPVVVSRAAPPSKAAKPSLPRGWRRCVNSVLNYSIGYPGSWHTTQIRPAEACAQFHPGTFTIPPESEYPLTALNAKPVRALPSRGHTAYERTLRWQRTTVAGRSAVRFETVSTGAGQERAGTRQYGYVIRLGRGLISVHTTAAPGETRYAAWKGVVSRAARTLTATKPAPAPGGCVAVQPAMGFYEAGRVAAKPLTAPVSHCTTISVSDVVDRADPADRCQTFRVGFWPLVDGSLTYTEPVTACGSKRTVLARNVANNTRYQVVYDVDYIEPDVQSVKFRIWH